jgi:hypothetical protein
VPLAVFVPDRGVFKSPVYYSQTTTRHVNAFAKWAGASVAQTIPEDKFKELLP